MAGRSRYAVKSATLTFGSVVYDMANGPAGKSATCDAVEVTALSDTVKQFIKGALTEYDEFTVTLYQKDSGDVAESATPAALTIAVSLSNGEDADKSVTVSYNKAIVTKVAYPNQDASGDRKGTYDVTFRPDGSTAAA